MSAVALRKIIVLNVSGKAMSGIRIICLLFSCCHLAAIAARQAQRLRTWLTAIDEVILRCLFRAVSRNI